ncbi:MAG: hypothetical protein ABWZ40_00750, partial [Caulobacterales bacterium]
RIIGKLHRVFYDDQPAKWPVCLKVAGSNPRPAAPRKPLTEAQRLARWRRKHEPLWVHPQSLAERFEAVARVCRAPEHYARRLAIRMQRRAARLEFRLPQAIKSVKLCLPPRRQRQPHPDAPINPAEGILKELAMPAVRALAALYPRLRAEAQAPPEPVSVSLILAP